ncbi:MAG: SpvB/TcaC N-terminal domain-containing protein [Chloroflexota bacterium]
MNSITCFIVVFCLTQFWCPSAFGQVVFSPGSYKDSSFVLSNTNFIQNPSSNESFEFIGSHAIRLNPGFSFKANSATEFHGLVDPLYISYCKYLTQNEISQLESGNINTSLPVGSTTGISNVSPTGAFSYSIPIYTPAGINGLQPKISLVYNSQSGNGIAGWGWGLSGLSMITRNCEDMFRDGRIQQFSNNLSEDKLNIDGNRLVLVSGSFGQSGAVYGTEVGNTMRIQQFGSSPNDVYFIVKTKDGTTIEYGNSPDSRVFVVYKQANQDVPCTIAWKVSKIIDKFGNYISFSYYNLNNNNPKNGSGESVVRSIKYTGTSSSTNPFYEISFEYAYRSDQNEMFLAINNTNNFDSENDNSRASIKQKVILDKIKVSYIGASPAQVLRTYQLKYTNNKEEYDFSSYYTVSNSETRRVRTSSYSQLVSITEIGENGVELNPTVFSYDKPTPRSSLVQRLPIIASENENFVFGDFNGDGIQDRMRIERNHLIDGHLWAFWYLELGQYNNGSGSYSFAPVSYGIDGTSKMFQTYDTYSYWNGGDNKFYPDKCVAADFNGDGLDDIAVFNYHKSPVNGYESIGINIYHARYLSYSTSEDNYPRNCGIGFSPQPNSDNSIGMSQPLVISGGYGLIDPEECTLVPMNYGSNGEKYLIMKWKTTNSSGKKVLCLSPLDITHSTQVGPWISVYDAWDENTVFFPLQLDINSYSDVGFVYYDVKKVAKTYFGEFNENLYINPKVTSGIDFIEQDCKYDLGDLNGDGLTDIVYIDNDREIYYRYGTGNGFTSERKLNLSVKIPFYGPLSLFVLDLDGDGKKDILISYNQHIDDQPDISVYGCFFSVTMNKFSQQYFTTTDPLLDPTKFRDIYYKDKQLSGKNIDFTGDGNSDLYCIDNTNGHSILTFSSNNNPLHLKTIKDGLGNKTEVNYDAISNRNAYTNNGEKVYTFDDYNLESGITTIKSNIFVTSSVSNYQFSLSSSYSPVSTISYSYNKGLVHKYKGFLGFSDFKTSTSVEYDGGYTQIGKKLTFGLTNDAHFVMQPKEQSVTKNNVLTNTERWTYQLQTVNGGNTYFYSPDTCVTKDLLTNTSTITHYDNVDDYENVITENTSYLEDDVMIAYQTVDKVYNDIIGLRWGNGFLTKQITSSHREPNTGTFNSEVDYQYYGQNTGFALNKVINNISTSGESSITYGYDQYGNVISTSLSQVADGSLPPRETTMSYDPSGRFMTSKTNAGLTTGYEYYPHSGAVQYSTDVNGIQTTYDYDEFYREKKATKLTGSQAGSPVYTVMESNLNWSTSGSPSNALYYKEVSSNSSTASAITYYSSLGRELRTETEAFNTSDKLIVDKHYYDDGRLRSQSYPYFTSGSPLEINYYYDQYLRPSQVTDKNQTTTTTYGSRGKARGISITDPAGKEVFKEYDALGNIIESSEINSSGIATNSVKYTYANNFKLLNTTSKAIDEADALSITRDYDSYGNMIKLTDDNLGEFAYQYNAFGELEWERLKSDKDANGQVYHYNKYYSYDELGRVQQEIIRKVDANNNELSTEQRTMYSYKAGSQPGAGQIDHIDLYMGTSWEWYHQSLFDYDVFGNVTNKYENIHENSTYTQYPYTYAYDGFGRLSTKTYPSGVETKMNYDAITGLMYKTDRVDGGNNETLWEMKVMNEDGASVEYDMGCGALKTQRMFNSFKYPTQTVTTAMGATIQNLEYSFNAVTRTCSYRKDLLPTHNQEDAFVYDDLYRLTDIYSTNNLLGQAKPFGMEYHDDGSIKSNNEIGNYQYKTYSNNNLVLTKPYQAVKATSNSPYSEKYIPNLQVTEYNYLRLIKRLQDDEDDATFQYGWDNSRLEVKFKKLVNGVWSDDYTKYYLADYEKYVYHNNNTTKEITYINTPNGLIATIIKTTLQSSQLEKTYYVQKDYLGSILALSEVEYSTPLTNPPTPVQVTVVAKFSYDAWGNPRHFNDWMTNYYNDMNVPNFDILERGFTGHEHIRQFNLINMNARLYDPRVGRFLSPDSYIPDPENPQSYNRYSYALNNPLSYTDPTGNTPEGPFYEEPIDDIYNQFLPQNLNPFIDIPYEFFVDWQIDPTMWRAKKLPLLLSYSDKVMKEKTEEERDTMQRNYLIALQEFDYFFPDYEIEPGVKVIAEDGISLANARGDKYYVGLFSPSTKSLYLDSYTLLYGISRPGYGFKVDKSWWDEQEKRPFLLIEAVIHEAFHCYGYYNIPDYKNWSKANREAYAISYTNYWRRTYGLPLEDMP